MLALFFLAACSGGDAPADDIATNGDDTAVDTAPACATLNAGTDWVWNGECPQMRTPCAIVVTECSLAIDYSATSMTMGMPYSGTIGADGTITFADDDTVTGCVGTIEDADTVSGACDGGCTFTLKR